MGNADKSPVPRGSLEFMQMKYNKGSPGHLTLAPCCRISLEPGGLNCACGSQCIPGILQLMWNRRREWIRTLF